MNVRFEYLYRDAGNYKRWGEVIFSNAKNIEQSTLDKLAGAALPFDEMYFLPDRVGIPSLHFTDWINDLDHCWHEIHVFELCDEAANDLLARDIAPFLESVFRRPVVF